MPRHESVCCHGRGHGFPRRTQLIFIPMISCAEPKWASSTNNAAAYRSHSLHSSGHYQCICLAEGLSDRGDAQLLPAKDLPMISCGREDQFSPETSLAHVWGQTEWHISSLYLLRSSCHSFVGSMGKQEPDEKAQGWGEQHPLLFVVSSLNSTLVCLYQLQV